MKKIESYTLSSKDIYVISDMACSTIINLRLKEPWDYDIQVTFGEDCLSVHIEMRGVAYDCSFKAVKGISSLYLNTDYVDSLFALKDRVSSADCDLAKITVSVRLTLVEKSPKVKFGVKAYDIQLFEL